MALNLARLLKLKVSVRNLSSWRWPSKDVCTREPPPPKKSADCPGTAEPVVEKPPCCVVVSQSCGPQSQPPAAPYPVTSCTAASGPVAPCPTASCSDKAQSPCSPAGGNVDATPCSLPPPFAPCPPALPPCPPPPPPRPPPQRVTDDDLGDVGPYRLVTMLIIIPMVMALSLWTLVYNKTEHERPPYVPYEFMYIRKKPFPWPDGNKSLFHNPHVNALPDGYEDEEE